MIRFALRFSVFPLVLVVFLVFSAGSLFAQTTILTENFEGATFVPVGWTQYDETGDTSTREWARSNFAGADKTPNGNWAAIMSWDGAQTINRALETPAMDFSPYIGCQVSFYVFMKNNYGETVFLEISTNGSGPTATWTVLASYLNDGSNNGWIFRTISLSAYNQTPNIRLRWRSSQPLNNNSNGVDLITVTGSVPTGNPPNAPTLTAPANNVWTTTTIPTFTWTFSDPDPGDLQSAFQVQVDDDPAFAGVDRDSGTVTSGVGSWSGLSPALADGIWYWRVRTRDDSGISGWGAYSAPWSTKIDTTDPAPPVVTSSTHPVEGFPYASPSVTLSWPATDGGAGVTEYFIAWDNSPTIAPGTLFVPGNSVGAATTGARTASTRDRWYLHAGARDALGHDGGITDFLVSAALLADFPVSAVAASTAPAPAQDHNASSTAAVFLIPASSTADFKLVFNGTTALTATYWVKDTNVGLPTVTFEEPYGFVGVSGQPTPTVLIAANGWTRYQIVTPDTPTQSRGVVLLRFVTPAGADFYLDDLVYTQ